MKKVSPKRLLILVSLLALLGGCATSRYGDGKYFDHDGPPADFDESTPLNGNEVELKVEKPVRAANRPYTVMGQSFRPMTGDAPLTQVGIASWYGKQFHGRKTAIGDRYDMFAMTAAHPTMELPSFAKVTNLRNGRSVIVRVNDRGPFIGGRAIDMSYAAAVKLGYAKAGTAKVRIERITRKEIAEGYQEKMMAEALAKTPTESPAFAENKPMAQGTPETKTLVRETDTAMRVDDTTPQSQSTEKNDDPLSTVLTSAPTVDAASSFEPVADAAPLIISTEDVIVAQDTPAVVSPAVETVTPVDDTPKPSSTPSPGWSAQIGAYRNLLNAKEAAAHAEMMLSEQTFSLPVRVVEDNSIYRVLIGNFNNLDEARRLLPKLFDTLGIKPFLTKK